MSWSWVPSWIAGRGRRGLAARAHQWWNRRELVGRGLVDHAKGKRHAPLVHALVVADAALEQVGVGEHDLLAGEAAHARGLEADLFDRAQLGAAPDEGA